MPYGVKPFGIQPYGVDIQPAAAGGLTLPLTGVAATSAPGTAGVAASKALTGSGASAAVGTVTTSAGGNLTLALTGVAATAGLGSVVANLSKILAGNAATAGIGSIVYSGAVTLSGAAGAGAVGTVAVAGGNLTLALSGVSAAGSTGTVVASGGIPSGLFLALSGVGAVSGVGSATASGGAVFTGFTRRGRPRVPLTNSSSVAHRQQIAQSVNGMMTGDIDAALQVTLQPRQGSTVVTDNRISIYKAAAACPLTATAAQELASGAMWWVPADGSMTINHANNMVTDRTFMFSLIG